MFNAVLTAGAIRAYIGPNAAVLDMGLGAFNWLVVEPRPDKEPAKTPQMDAQFEWSPIHYHGDRRLARDPRIRGDRRRRIGRQKR